MVPGILTDVRALGNLGSVLRTAAGPRRSAIPSWTQFEQPGKIRGINDSRVMEETNAARW